MGVGVGLGVFVGVGVGVFVGIGVGVGVFVGIGVGVGPGPVPPVRPLAMALSKVSPLSSWSREKIIAPAMPLLLINEVLAAMDCGLSPV